MTAQTDNQLYCSVDLEFTGFDPARDQILEIGFAFFRMTSTGVEITEQWSQVFKPTIEVHPKIFGLTGITQAELDAAPEFNEHREFLQEKLGKAIIVGHNPVMDVRFLEAYGLKLSGQVIDTLELVQFILPTHHSYNLENLVHYFGIQHTEAHRALGDALSTIAVLESLLRVYQNFPNKLQEELADVINRGEFSWQPLLSYKLPEKEQAKNDSLKEHHNFNVTPLLLHETLITIDEDVNDHEARVAIGLTHQSQPAVLAVADSVIVMRLWKAGLVHGVFKTEDTFSNHAFTKFLETAQTNEQLRFCLKVIVWLHTNWQTEVVFDLNISFFGGQFRQFIVGGQPRLASELVLGVDYATLQSLATTESPEPLLASRELVVCDMQQFEKFVSSGFGTRLSWSGSLYALRLIYNPETDFGNHQLKDKVLAALISTDLFFGLVYMSLHQSFPNQQYATLSDLANNHQHIFTRLQSAAENLKSKLQAIQSKAASGELNRIINFLEGFFMDSPGRVKWVNIDERNLAFTDLPIDITENVKQTLAGFSRTRFTETITDQGLLSYLVDRLGLDTEVAEIPNKTIPSSINIVASEQALSDQDLYALTTSAPLPLVIVLPESATVKEFYNNHYQEIKKNAALFAQGYSGGGNKMFRNFSIRENSILLGTADFIARQNYKLAARTVIFAALPPLEAAHPYTAALLAHWHKRHPDLGSLFQLGKVIAVLKKIKVTGSVAVRLFGAADAIKKTNFVDNTH